MVFLLFLNAVRKHWWSLLSCAVFTLLGAWIAYADKSNSWAIRAMFVIAGFCLFCACFLAWMDEHKRADELRAKLESKPRIIPKFPDPISVSKVHWSGTDKFSTDVVRIRFVNDPVFPSPMSLANDVIAKVTFSENGSTIELDGRWSSSDQPSTRVPGTSRNDLLKMSFGIGDERDLDIAIRLSNGECYAINNDNFDHPMLRHAQHRLRGHQWMVTVKLRGALVDETYEFQIQSTDVGFSVVRQNLRNPNEDTNRF